jgi:hypothetical protein
VAKVGLDRCDVDVALPSSTGRGGMGGGDLREIGAGRIVSGSALPGIGCWTFPFSDTGISEVAVCARLAVSGRGSSCGRGVR